MARTSNQEHVARTLRALSTLRAEPGWHQVTRLAEVVGAKPARLAADLRRCCYAADDWHLPLLFGSDIEPEHPDGDAVVQLAPDMPLMLPLPTSRVEILRLALLSGAAARREPDHPSAPTLRALDTRLTTILHTQSVDIPASEPASADALRKAIAQHRQITFLYRALTDTTAAHRTVIPLKLQRRGKWWVLDATSPGHGDITTYRIDRIIGPVNDAGQADSTEKAETAEPSDTTDTAAGNEPIRSTAIRIELDEDDLWAVDDFSPTGLEHLNDDRVQVTIHLFAPVAERLSRLLFLINPATTKILSGHTFLETHTQRVTQQLHPS